MEKPGDMNTLPEVTTLRKSSKASVFNQVATEVAAAMLESACGF